MLKPIQSFVIAFFSIFGFTIVLVNLLSWQGISLAGRLPGDIENTYFGIGSMFNALRAYSENDIISKPLGFMKVCISHLGNAITYGNSLPPVGMTGAESMSWWQSLDVGTQILQIFDSTIGWLMIPLYATGILASALWVASNYLLFVLFAFGGMYNTQLPNSHYDMPGALHTMLMIRKCIV